MKTYRAVIKTTQEWTKDIKIPDDKIDIRDFMLMTISRNPL